MHCGTQVADDVRFCTQCGAVLGHKEAPSAASTAGARTATANPNPPAAAPVPPTGTPRRARGPRARWGVVVAGVVAVGALAAAYWAITASSRPAAIVGVWAGTPARIPLPAVPLLSSGGVRLTVTREGPRGHLQGTFALPSQVAPVTGRVRGDRVVVLVRWAAPGSSAAYPVMKLKATVQGDRMQGTLQEQPGATQPSVTMPLTLHRAPVSAITPLSSSLAPAVSPRGAAAMRVPRETTKPERVSTGVFGPTTPGATVTARHRPVSPRVPTSPPSGGRAYLQRKEQQLQHLLNQP